MGDPQAAAIAERLLDVIAQARNALVIEAAANLAEACPIDTGHARANFVPSIGAPHEGAPDNGRAAAQGVAFVATSKSPIAPGFVANGVPYVVYLLAGSSEQAPAGWDLAALDAAVATVQAQYATAEIDLDKDSAIPSASVAPRAPGEEAP